MDSHRPDESSPPDARIAALINDYFDRRQAGEELTPESFAAEHPDLAEELLPYLEGLSLLDRIRPVREEDARTGDIDPAGAELPTIAGYRLLEEIGRGGMGVAYKALQLSTKRIVALKVMLAGPFSSPSARRRFEREVELAARFQHSGIVRVLESGRVNQQQYYAMDYVAGVPLSRYLSTTEPDIRTTLGIFQRICEAVEYAHRHGVVHRDLKPANVLVDDEGEPHILDFGLAKATDQDDTEESLTTRVSLPGQVVGTLFYLSPEQAAGMPGEVDPRTDVYSLGVMLYEALTGSLPFDTRGRPSEVIQRILEAPPIPPSSLSVRVDSELGTILLKALAKESDRRYPSAQAMAEDIRRYLEGEPISARRPSSLYFLRKKALKYRWTTILCLTIVVAVLIGLGLRSFWQERELARARRIALGAQRALEAGDVETALGDAQALRAKHPRVTEPRLTFAQAQYLNESTRASGVLTLERMMQGPLFPGQWAFRLLLAEMYRDLGDAGRANEVREQAEREAPDTAEGWYLRSFATLDPHRALQCAQETVRREPSHALAWQRLAWLCLKTQDLDGALQAADKLLALHEDRVAWTVFKGQVLARQGRFPQAIEQYTRAMSMDPRPSGAYLFRAHTYRRLKDYPRAVADYTRRLEFAGEKTADVWDYYQRATPLWILGRADEALEDYEWVRSLLGRPFYSDARRFLILHELGREAEAQEVLVSALRDVKDDWLREIFRCLDGQVEPAELVAAAEERDDPEKLCEACYYAGEVCLRSGELAEARSWFEQCLQTGVEFDLNTSLLTPMNEYELAEWRLASPPLRDVRGE